MEQEVKRKKKKVLDDNMAKSVNKVPEVKKQKKRKYSPLIPILCLIIGILLGVIGTILFYDKLIKINPISVVEETEDMQNAASSQEKLDEMLEEESFVIETPDGNLYYPLKWQEQVRVEQLEGEVYTVNFYGTIGDKGEQFLFGVMFGGEEGTLVGTLNEVPVYVTTTLGNVTEEWTEEEQLTFYSMQEDINHMLGMLQKEEGFVSAI